MTTSTMQRSNLVEIGLNSAQLTGVTAILQRVLADEYILYTKTRNFHWNVTGPLFHLLHEMFEQQYTVLEAVIDEVAERIRNLGSASIGTVNEFAEFATLNEKPGAYPVATAMASILLHDHEQIIRNLRRDVVACADEFHDMGTNDFLTGLMKQHEKMAWMLRATIA
ncbi:MAG: DNA starvation/stationary phase protection protein [Chloroflexaceae bacterium]|nr:DNA starvation/stationary phase protection protein [Chloroflexaceae bacterium]NJL34392.1 DNA starvation/stationary phase protection protein [Chloroflexaceae bacterium]NJO05142.1 DNA starvation/stationary phase protection protein [Chloroflexaceae bacterium]